MLALSVAIACDPRPRVAQPCISLARERSCSPFCAPPAHAGEPGEEDAAAVESCGGNDWTRGAVWRGGELLAELLHAQPCLVRGRGVLEVGAGTGVAGLAAAAAGAAHVTLTDRDLSASSASLSLNPALQETGAVDVRHLAWGDAPPSLAAAVSLRNAQWLFILDRRCPFPRRSPLCGGRAVRGCARGRRGLPTVDRRAARPTRDGAECDRASRPRAAALRRERRARERGARRWPEGIWRRVQQGRAGRKGGPL
mmetsp:Transcript_40584/g.127970  ORF Transcript_40584/g.127970 Transcript_40584/m.127970 type:complete len:254 (-) Transcript_40584:253-1014(-)